MYKSVNIPYKYAIIHFVQNAYEENSKKGHILLGILYLRMRIDANQKRDLGISPTNWDLASPLSQLR